MYADRDARLESTSQHGRVHGLAGPCLDGNTARYVGQCLGDEGSRVVGLEEGVESRTTAVGTAGVNGRDEICPQGIKSAGHGGCVATTCEDLVRSMMDNVCRLRNRTTVIKAEVWMSLLCETRKRVK